MQTGFRRHNNALRQKRMVVFAIGAALGSALGFVGALLLTRWMRADNSPAVQRKLRRFGGDDQRPHFDMLAQ